MPELLRVRWGFGHGQDRVSKAAIRELALWSEPHDVEYNKRLVREVQAGEAARNAHSGVEGRSPATVAAA